LISQIAPAVLLLASSVDYWGFQPVDQGLRSLHYRLMEQLVKDGFVPDTDVEHCYVQIDFSRSFCSKGGELVSYFYRKINRMYSVEYSNLEALANKQGDLSKCALVILDDFVGYGGCQFLSFSYRNYHPDLFNRYGKVYVAILIANNLAVQTFQQASG